MNVLRERLELNFDPTDADDANQLAYGTLALLRACRRVLDAYEEGSSDIIEATKQMQWKVIEAAALCKVLPRREDEEDEDESERQIESVKQLWKELREKV